MTYILCVVGGIIIGGVVAWLLAVSQTRHQLGRRLEESERRANIAEGRASGLDGTIAELRAQGQKAAEDFGSGDVHRVGVSSQGAVSDSGRSAQPGYGLGGAFSRKDFGASAEDEGGGEARSGVLVEAGGV